MAHLTSQEISDRFAAIEAGAAESWSNLWLVENLWKLGQAVAMRLGPRDDVVVQLTDLSTKAFDARVKDIPKLVARLGALRTRAVTKLQQRETPTNQGA